METTKVLYIAGVERSGSTIFQNVLGQASGLFACGELRQLWHRSLLQGRPCGCEVEPLADCSFWQQVFERAFGGIENVRAKRWYSYRRRMRTRHFPLLFLPKGSALLRSRLGEYPRVLEQLYTAIREASGGSVIIDSSKSPTHAWLLGSIAQLEVFVVHLTRDPRGVVHSILKRKRQGHPGYSNRSLWRSAIEWRLVNYLSEKLRSMEGIKYERMRYEAFTQRPLKVVKQILDWVDEEDGDLSWIEGRTVSLSTTHTTGGSPHRFSTGTIHLREDTAWKDNLRSDEMKHVERWAGSLMDRYGYDRAH
jgi:hypothetical protein